MTAETVRPRAILTRPLFLLAIATLALNDHVLKGVCPGLLTGKLSDVAGLFAFPLGVWAALDLVSAQRVRLRVLAAVAALTGVGFTLLKTSAAARMLYLLPYDAAGIRAAIAPDLTDLLCLPLLGLAVLYGRWHLSAPTPQPLAPRLTRAIGLGGFVLATVATPAIPSHRFMLSPQDPATVAYVMSGLTITGAEVYVTEGARGLIFDDDPSASASVVFRCANGIQPRSIPAEGFRVIVGDSVWALDESKLEKQGEHWRAWIDLEPVAEGVFFGRQLNPLRFTLATDRGQVQVVCALRPAEQVMERQLDRGRRLLGQRKYAAALKVFDWMLLHNARGGRLGRAKALLGLGKKEEGYAELSRVAPWGEQALEAGNLMLEMKPKDEKALWMRCSYYMSSGSMDARGGAAAMTAYLEAHPTGINASYARIWRNDFLKKIQRDEAQGVEEEEEEEEEGTDDGEDPLLPEAQEIVPGEKE